METAVNSESLRYFTYCRKSSDSEDKQIASLPDQVLTMTEIANEEKLKIIEVFQEAQSAFHIGRPVFDEMMRRIDNGEANAVLTWSSNRIARNSMDGGRFIYMFDQKKIIELKTYGGVFHNTPEHKYALNNEFSLAKKSSDDLSVAVKRGNRYKFFRDKEWGGCAKPGYKNVTDIARKNHIKTDGKRFRLLKRALNYVASFKATPMESFHLLNNKWCYRTRKTAKLGGRKLNKSSFYRVLTDPFYYGLMVRNMEGKRCEEMGHHTPMINEEQYDIIQMRLGKKGSPRKSNKDFPFKTVLRCGECGGSVTCEEKWQIICSKCKKKFHKGENTDKCLRCGELVENMKNPKILHYVFYHCTKRVHHDCTQGSIAYKEMNSAISKELDKFEIPVWYKDWAIDNMSELNDYESTSQTDIKESLIKRLNQVDREIKNTVRIRCSQSDFDAVKNEIYNQQEDRLISEKKEITKELKQWSENQDKWVMATRETFVFAHFAKYWFEKGTPETKTWVLSKLGQNLTIKDKKLHIYGEKPFYLVEKMKIEVVQELERLEPDKIPILSKETLSLPAVCLSMRRGRDSNPRAFYSADFPGLWNEPLSDLSKAYYFTDFEAFNKVSSRTAAIFNNVRSDS